MKLRGSPSPGLASRSVTKNTSQLGNSGTDQQTPSRRPRRCAQEPTIDCVTVIRCLMHASDSGHRPLFVQVGQRTGRPAEVSIISASDCSCSRAHRGGRSSPPTAQHRVPVTADGDESNSAGARGVRCSYSDRFADPGGSGAVAIHPAAVTAHETPTRRRCVLRPPATPARASCCVPFVERTPRWCRTRGLSLALRRE